MPFINSIAALHDEMTAWRRDFHAHPELSMQESRTSAVVRQRLEEFGVDEIITGLATHGVVGVIRNGLQLIGVDSIYQVLITGILVIAAVAVDQFARRSTR